MLTRFQCFMIALLSLAASPTTQPVQYDVHDGYFVSNQFEPAAERSFVVLTSQKDFDEVFGVGHVMHDQSHRLPKDAFDTRIVLGAIVRGKMMCEFRVVDVTVDHDVVTLNYTTTITPHDTAEFACPLIVSIPTGNYTSVRFIADEKLLKTVDLKPAATQPAK